MARANRTTVLGVRLMPTERQAIEDLAEERGERLSETARALLGYAIRAERKQQRRVNRSGEPAFAA